MEQTHMNSTKVQNEKKVDIYITPKTVIINLLKAEEKYYVKYDRVMEFVEYIYNQLVTGGHISPYVKRVIFEVNFDAIERTVRYYDKLFDLIGETIYLRQNIDKAYESEGKEDEIDILELAKSFVAA
jgi:uncharacterized protein YfeS